MKNRIPWFERTFRFDFPWEIYPEQIERIRGTPARAGSLIEGLPREALTRRHDGHWSIQENIAHLADLDEELFLVRVEQFVKGESKLLAADVTNRLTNQADHNARSIEEVMERVRGVRARLVARLESLPHETFARAALHPRLNTPMRLTDLIYFNGEHDDYHMANITGIRRGLRA
jgi:uncharacterized damage-inducible protein DinB